MHHFDPTKIALSNYKLHQTFGILENNEKKLTYERMKHLIDGISFWDYIPGIYNTQFCTILEWMFTKAQVIQ